MTSAGPLSAEFRHEAATKPKRLALRNDVLAWVKCKRKRGLKAKSGKSLRIADVFCGCGGLTLGTVEAARKAGYVVDIRLAIDTDAAAVAVYNANFSPGDALVKGSVEELLSGELGLPPTQAEKVLTEQCGSVNILLAGAPCQGHSDLNNSTRRDDPRNQLYLRAVRGVEVLRPEFAFIENVPSVVHDKQNVVGEATRNLQRIGYNVTSAVISVRDLGLPQRRRRHILFASRFSAVSIEHLLPHKLKNATVGVNRFIADIIDEPEHSNQVFSRPARITDTNQGRVDYLFDHDIYDLPDRLRPPCHRDKAHTYQSVYGRMRWSEPAQTITSGFGSMGQGRYVHPKRRRLITPHEAARIQGFPDFFDFTAAGGVTALRTMIGNAVPPPMMVCLVGRLLEMGFL